MKSNKSIGGYFSLELSNKGNYYYPQMLRLNTGRNCFQYILLVNKAKRVYIPKYTCGVMLEPLKKLNIDFVFYSINENLELAEDLILSKNEFLLYTNYFGLKDKYCSKLSRKFKSKLILDYSQSFYAPPQKLSSVFYSPRKFFGLPDGGIVNIEAEPKIKLDRDSSCRRMSHLLKRLDLGVEEGYEDFKKNDASLSNQPIKKMSHLTEELLKNIDYKKAKEKRLKNFNYLHKKFCKKNKLKIDLKSITCPMCYPYYSEDLNLRQKLIKNKIFVATYWSNVFDWCQKGEIEYKLAQKIIPLPIDQRYDIEDMDKIIRKINEN
jgi:hypothetical protein